MVYAYDQNIQLPTRDLYDTQVMAMAINAAKDMYENGQQEIKDFTKTYGDFITPIMADQDWYDQNVTGKLRDTINALYAQGIDPLRNAQARAIISQTINNMPYGEMAKRKLASSAAQEYIKNRGTLIAAGKFDPDFERFRLNGKSLEDWDTSKDGLWTQTAPSEFKDMNTWTHHLFDNMELSYDPELSKKYPGFMAYTKSRDTMGKIIDNNIAQLLNTDLGKYYLSKYLNEIPGDFQGDRRQEALNRFKNEVINSNWEEGQVKLEQDPYALAKYKADLDVRNARRAAASQPSENLSYNYLSGVFQRGITTPFGYDRVTGGEQALNDMMKNQYTFGQSLALKGKTTVQDSYKAKGVQYVNKFTTYESPAMFAASIARQPQDDNGSVLLSPDDIKHLRSTEDVVTNTYGYTNQRIPTDYNKIPQPISSKNGDQGIEFSQNIYMIPYREVYTAYRKTGSVESDWRVRLVNADTGESYGDYWYNLPIESERNADVPRISEWRVDKDGNYYLPGTKKGKRRDQVKAGVRQKVSGQYETSSLSANKNLGVSKHGLNTENAFNLESVARSPF